MNRRFHLYIVHMEIPSTLHSTVPFKPIWAKNSLILTFPLGDVEPHLIHPSFDRPHSSPQMTARSFQALSHNYATKSPLVTMGCPTSTPKTAPFWRSLPPSNTPISLWIALTTPIGIKIQSAVFLQFTHQTDWPTDRQTDRPTYAYKHCFMTCNTISFVSRLIWKCFRWKFIDIFEDVCSLHICFSADSFHLLCGVMLQESSGRFLGHPIYTVGHKKTCPFYFFNNSGKYWRIFIIFSLLYSGRNCGIRACYNFRLTLSLLPHYLVKLEMLSVLIYNNATKSYLIQNWRKMSSHSTNT